MKQHEQKPAAGVWIDHQKAIIISKETGEYAVKEKIGAPALFQTDNELHKNNARHGDMISYFKELSNHLHAYDKILLFGTGIAQEQFHNYLKEDAQFHNKHVTLENTGHLTDHQMVAKVREFFN